MEASIVEKQETQSLCLVLFEGSTQSSHQMMDFSSFQVYACVFRNSRLLGVSIIHGNAPVESVCRINSRPQCYLISLSGSIEIALLVVDYQHGPEII